MKKLTYDDFLEKYTPEYNQILLEQLRTKEDTGNILPEDICSYGGTMYETFGEELDYIREQPNKRVWTIVDGDGDDLIIIAGKHFVNRMGYIVTDEEWEDEYEEYEA
jgi:hypothetical protein